jgi:DNA-binding LytR/AlgR family response regulator
VRLLSVLAVDDEQPALEELEFLLEADPRVGVVHRAATAEEALRLLGKHEVDGVFLDIRLPGLDGLDLARALTRFASRPAVVFVSAYDDAAVDAFSLRAVDYLLKPVSSHRLAEAVRRVAEVTGVQEADDPVIPVELGGVTRFVHRTDVRYVEAAGDYARLHTATGSHLVRISLSTLEQRWREAGFSRIHRSYLVALHHVRELHVDSAGGVQVLVDDVTLPVSRRHSRELRDQLVRAARPGGPGPAR